MQEKLLIVEDVLLLLIDDEDEVIHGEGTLHYTLGGAVLVELALLGRVEVAPGRGLSGPTVTAVGSEPLDDPLLQDAWDKIAKKSAGAQTLILQIGGKLREVIIDRLVERGLIRREQKRLLGFIPYTRFSTEETPYEPELLRKVRATLVDGAAPDVRTAAVTAMVSASGSLPSLHKSIPWNSDTRARAKELEEGNWGADAVSTAIARNALAISVSVATAATVAATTAATTTTS